MLMKDKIINNIKDEKINYICIPGDLIDGTNILDEKNNEKIVINFIKRLSKISKVIISVGNHDISRLRSNSFDTKWKPERNEVYFEKLKKLNNVYLLDNEIYTDNDISFIGFTPSFKYYKEKDEDRELLIQELNDKMIKINKNNYNILLCHSPIHMLDKNVLEKAKLMKDIDLILSGHMHNGMVPPIIEKIWKGNCGIITPNKKLYPKAKVARGIIKKENKTLIISGGITKLSYSAPTIFHPFNDFFPMNIELININN